MTTTTSTPDLLPKRPPPPPQPPRPPPLPPPLPLDHRPWLHHHHPPLPYRLPRLLLHLRCCLLFPRPPLLQPPLPLPFPLLFPSIIVSPPVPPPAPAPPQPSTPSQQRRSLLLTLALRWEAERGQGSVEGSEDSVGEAGPMVPVMAIQGQERSPRTD